MIAQQRLTLNRAERKDDLSLVQGNLAKLTLTLTLTIALTMTLIITLTITLALNLILILTSHTRFHSVGHLHRRHLFLF